MAGHFVSAFAQDKWRVGERLTLTLGVRYDVEWIPLDEADNPAFPDRGRYPVDTNNFAPRLGLAYQLNAKTVIRTGAGIFYGEPNSLSTEGANYRSGPPRSQDIAIQTNYQTTPVFVQHGFPDISNTA